MLHPNTIPQADRLERVGEFVLLTGLGSTALRDLLFVDRDRHYYAAAATSLGLLEDGDEVSDEGAALAERPAAVMHSLASSLEQSKVGKAWSTWADMPLAEVSSSTAEAFLEANTELAASTLARRAQTLRRWLDAARPFLESAALPSDPSWTTLQQLVPESVRAVAPERVPQMPTRVLTHCTRHGLHTLGDLLGWSESELAEGKGMGTKSIRDLRRALKGLVETQTDPETRARTAAFEPKHLADAVGSLLPQLNAREETVLRSRLAMGAPRRTLDEIAGEMSLSRERVRQIESRGFEQLGRLSQFLDVFRSKLDEGLGDKTAADYLQLGEWWPADEIRLFQMVFKYLGPEDVSLEPWGESILLRKAGAPDLENAYRTVDAWIKTQSLPLNVAFMDLELAPQVAEPHLRALVRDRLLERWSVVSTPAGEAIVDRGSTRRARILEHLLGSPSPIAMKEIEEHFGRGALPDEVVYVRRGWVTLPDHLPGFDEWARRLAAPLEAYVTGEGPEREWMAHHLLEYANGIAKLPEWISPMLLASMLHRTERFESLGRQRLKLAGAEVAERTHLLPKLVEFVEAFGGPLEDAALLGQLREHVQVRESTYELLRNSPPLFRTGDGRIGLMPRDIPGGEEAMGSVVGPLVRAIDVAGQELVFQEALACVHRLGGAHAAWTLAHLRGAARAADALRPTRSSVGVVESAAQGFLIDDAQVVPSAPKVDRPKREAKPLELPSAIDLALPRDARGLYTRLRTETTGDLDVLARRVQAHAIEFEDASRASEFLPVDEARAIAGAYPKLLARARKDGSRLFLALAWVVGRYFEISDDGTLDFSIGGLDDDVAVFNAAARYMDAADLEIEQEF